MVSNLDRALNPGHKQTDVIIMDFAKAFDKVPHRKLSYKTTLSFSKKLAIFKHYFQCVMNHIL